MLELGGKGLGMAEKIDKSQPNKVVSIFRAMSTLVARASLANRLGKTFGGDRDIYLSLGYKKT